MVRADARRARGEAGQVHRIQVWWVPHTREFGLDCQGLGEPLKNLKQGREMDTCTFGQITLAISERIIGRGKECAEATWGLPKKRVAPWTLRVF